MTSSAITPTRDGCAQAWIQTRFPPGWTIVVPSQLAFDPRVLEDKGIACDGRRLQVGQGHRRAPAALERRQAPAVVMLPRWGADPRFEGQTLARCTERGLTSLACAETFGREPVLVNYLHRPSTATRPSPSHSSIRVKCRRAGRESNGGGAALPPRFPHRREITQECVR